VKKPKPPYNEKSAIRSALRTAWHRHPRLKEVLKRERIERNLIRKDGTKGALRVFYRCDVCGGEFPAKNIQVDHVQPVGPTPGSKLAPPELTWDTFIGRLFCPAENLKTVCKTCHKKKTDKETAERWEAMKNAV
jgi:5-methylcytosine-specific restriction endonuclease McrA